jgi:hypothetical protein
MRIRSIATTALFAGVLALGGTATAQAADPGPTTANATNSPGVLSGDVVQVPIYVPINACGDSVDIIALLNPAALNSCTNK